MVEYFFVPNMPVMSVFDESPLLSKVGLGSWCIRDVSIGDVCSMDQLSTYEYYSSTTSLLLNIMGSGNNVGKYSLVIISCYTGRLD